MKKPKNFTCGVRVEISKERADQIKRLQALIRAKHSPETKTICINGNCYRPATLSEISSGVATWNGQLFLVPEND